MSTQEAYDVAKNFGVLDWTVVLKQFSYERRY